MAFTKITSADRLNKGVTGLPDYPQLTAIELQTKFDELGNLAIDGINNHIDELGEVTAAGNLGAITPNGISAQANVQSILNALTILGNTLSTASHTHPNAQTLNDITAEAKALYDRICGMLSSITVLQNTLLDSAAAIPTSHAVKAYVDNKDYTATVSGIAYPIGSVYECANTANPGAIFGGTWQEISNIDGIHKWVRRE